MKRDQNGFHTFRGYELMDKGSSQITASMEDYLEMVFRLSRKKGYTRIGDIAVALNVQPPSASNMIQKLAELGYIEYEKYGVITLTENGVLLGAYLLERHEIVERFLHVIGVTQHLLADTERIEHNLSPGTVACMDRLVTWLESNQAWKDYLGGPSD